MHVTSSHECHRVHRTRTSYNIETSFCWRAHYIGGSFESCCMRANSILIAVRMTDRNGIRIDTRLCPLNGIEITRLRSDEWWFLAYKLGSLEIGNCNCKAQQPTATCQLNCMWCPVAGADWQLRNTHNLRRWTTGWLAKCNRITGQRAGGRARRALRMNK